MSTGAAPASRLLLSAVAKQQKPTAHATEKHSEEKLPYAHNQATRS
jgi:hypothetical protein